MGNLWRGQQASFVHGGLGGEGLPEEMLAPTAKG